MMLVVSGRLYVHVINSFCNLQDVQLEESNQFAIVSKATATTVLVSHTSSPLYLFMDHLL